MIRYALTCAKDHAFESWFQSASAYDVARAAGHVTCPLCGSDKVEKALMAPAVKPARSAAKLSPPDHPAAEAIAALRAEVEANSDYVGLNFAAEARKMHEGDIPARAIYGEAKWEEARALLEDGIPVAPLPFTPKRKAN